MTQEEIARAYDMAERGYKIGDIAKALYMSKSNVKRHIDYIEHRKRTMRDMYEHGVPNKTIAEYMGYASPAYVRKALKDWGIKEASKC